MHAHFILWGRPNSHNVKKVAWFAEELGLPFERRDMGGAFGYTDEYLAKNPNRLVPMIEDGKVVLWESNAIVRYMAAEYGGARWFAPDPIDRALADRWMDWQITFANAIKGPFLAFARTPAEERDAAAIETGIAACARLLMIMEDHLEKHEWLSGATFGMGDVPMGCFIHTWFSLPAQAPFARPEFPKVARWYAKLTERAGFARHVMIPLT